MDADEPVAGFYEMRLARGGPPTGIRVWYGPPRDPVTGEEMDRSWRWQAVTVGDERVEIDRVWPMCMAHPIHEREFERQRRIVANLPDGSSDARVNPYRRTDWNTVPPPTF